MRIFMVISQLLLHKGGAEQQALKLARALGRRGHEVEIITTRMEGHPAREDIDGVPVRRLFTLGNRRLVWRVAPYTYSALLLRELLARRGEHDIVHAHQAFHPAFVGVVARKLGGAPVVMKVATAGEYGDIFQMKSGQTPLVASRAMLGEILSGVDAIAAISGAIRDELLSEGVPAARIETIPNGVEVPTVTAADRAQARASLGLDPAHRMAVYVGRSEPQKGGDVLIDAWGRVGAPGSPMRLFIVGDGFRENAAYARAAAASGGTLTLAGRVSDVPRYLRAADLFVLPSRGEGLSNALLEAMAHGVPALVSDLPANLHLVTPGETGLAVPVGDAQALADALRAALADTAALAPLAQAASARIASDYTLDSVAARYERLYERLLASAKT